GRARPLDGRSDGPRGDGARLPDRLLRLGARPYSGERPRVSSLRPGRSRSEPCGAAGDPRPYPGGPATSAAEPRQCHRGGGPRPASGARTMPRAMSSTYTNGRDWLPAPATVIGRPAAAWAANVASTVAGLAQGP